MHFAFSKCPMVIKQFLGSFYGFPFADPKA